MKDLILKTIGDVTTGGGNDIGVHVDPVDDDGDLWTSVSNIIKSVIGVLGLVCVIVIIIGGVNYMTSSGDAGKVKKAKDTILYGVIGLVICVLAFAIVNFVLDRILGTS